MSHDHETPQEPRPARPAPAHDGAAPDLGRLLNRPASPQASGVSQKERELLTRSLVAAETGTEALREQVRDLERLLRMSSELSSILDPDALFEKILDGAVELTRADRWFLLLESGGALTGVRARDSERSSSDPTTPFSQSLARECLRQNDVVLYDSLRAAGIANLGASIADLRLQSAVCVPLHDSGRPSGVLYLDSSRLELVSSPNLLLLLKNLAAQASIALANARLHQSLERSRQTLARANEELRAELRANQGYARMVGQSPAMISIYERVRLVKDTDVFVLIQGESGTGKELVARALHEEGARRDGPFVPVNCGGFPSDLLESMMFGYAKGAFTGAIQDSIGLVEAADGGTLFLDEVADLPLALQVKLLRFLDGVGFLRVGEQVPRFANARVISATNTELLAQVQEGRFRRDLFYRLAVVKIDVPPLRERREDLPLLIEHFLQGASARTHRALGGMTERARLLLLRNPWTGNIRELKNVIEGAAALVPEGGLIDVAQIQAQTGTGTAHEARGGAAGALHEATSRFESDFLERVLSEHRWNVSRCAKELRISRQHLHNLVRRYGLVRPGR